MELRFDDPANTPCPLFIGRYFRGVRNGPSPAWMQRRLVFRETPMSEVAESFRRWYGTRLRLADASLASRHLTATFSGETPEAALEIIGLSLGAEIERRGDTAIVRAAGGSKRLR